MDAKSIWIPTIERTNYSTTHRLMNKPLKRNYKTKRGYDNALKNWNAKKEAERKQKRTDKINKTEVKNKQKLKQLGKKGKKGFTKFIKTNAPTIKNKALKIAKGTVNTAKGLGLSTAAIVAEKAVNNVVDRGFKQLKKETRGKNMTLKEYRAKRDAALKKENSTRGINRIPGAIKDAVKNKKIQLPNNKKLNPLSEENKKIREKKANMTKDNAGKTKAQIAAIKRKRDGKTIASVNAANKEKMREAARKRNEAFKRNRKLKIKKKKKNVGSKYPTLANIK